MSALRTIPHPLTPGRADQLRTSPKVRELAPAVLGARFMAGEGTTEVLVAFLLVTDSAAAAIVERGDRTGYELLTRDAPESDGEVWDRLNEWCDENGYPEPDR